jgi:hypothetical protein
MGISHSETASRSAPPPHRPHTKAAQTQRNHDEDQRPEVEEIPNQHSEPRRRHDPANPRKHAKPRQALSPGRPARSRFSPPNKNTKRLAHNDTAASWDPSRKRETIQACGQRPQAATDSPERDPESPWQPPDSNACVRSFYHAGLDKPIPKIPSIFQSSPEEVQNQARLHLDLSSLYRRL